MFPSDDSDIASAGQSGPTATVSREFARFGDTVDAKRRPSKPAFWWNRTLIVLYIYEYRCWGATEHVQLAAQLSLFGADSSRSLAVLCEELMTF